MIELIPTTFISLTSDINGNIIMQIFKNKQITLASYCLFRRIEQNEKFNC